MLHVYYLEDGRLKSAELIGTEVELPPRTVWLDLLQPSAAEEMSDSDDDDVIDAEFTSH